MREVRSLVHTHLDRKAPLVRLARLASERALLAQFVERASDAIARLLFFTQLLDCLCVCVWGG